METTDVTTAKPVAKECTYCKSTNSVDFGKEVCCLDCRKCVFKNPVKGPIVATMCIRKMEFIQPQEKTEPEALQNECCKCSRKIISSVVGVGKPICLHCNTVQCSESDFRKCLNPLKNDEKKS